MLIGDHTRFKFVYFLKNKSEAPKKAAEFVAQFNHAASSKSVTPVRGVGHLHMDNAGEFLSREFKDFLDEELISQTTCPPHVHQLNGVAERAIRSIMEQTRAHFPARSQCLFGRTSCSIPLTCSTAPQARPTRHRRAFRL